MKRNLPAAKSSSSSRLLYSDSEFSFGFVVSPLLPLILLVATGDGAVGDVPSVEMDITIGDSDGLLLIFCLSFNCWCCLAFNIALCRVAFNTFNCFDG